MFQSIGRQAPASATPSSPASLCEPLLGPNAFSHDDAMAGSASKSCAPQAPQPLLAVKTAAEHSRTAQAACAAWERLTPGRRMMLPVTRLDDLQAVPAMLEDMARRAGKLFVCLDHPDRIDDLLSELRRGADGWQVCDGPLQRLLSTGGWLYIHYEHFTAPEAESLNELFGTCPTFRQRQVHPEVTIFGAMLRNTLANEDRSEAFVSRFDAWMFDTSEARAFVDPLRTIALVSPQTCDTGDVTVIDLFGGDDYRNLLCATPCVRQGAAHVKTGRLREAVARGKTIVLRDGPWEDIAFRALVRDLQTGRFADLEGPLRLGPCALGRCDMYSQAHTDAALQACAFGSIDARDAPSAHIVTSRNFCFLKETVEIVDGSVLQTVGILDKLPAQAPLRVMGNLLPRQWRELVYGQFQRRIIVDAHVTLPPWLPASAILRDAPLGAAQAKVLTDLQDLQQLPQGSCCVVGAQDMQAASEGLLAVFPDAVCFDVTPEVEAGNLLFALQCRGGQFAFTATAMWRALQQERTVILRNLEINPNLRDDLLALLATPTPEFWCEGNRMTPAGRLVVLAERGAALHAHRRFVWEPNPTAVGAALKTRYDWLDDAWLQRTQEVLSDLDTLGERAMLLAGPRRDLSALASKTAAIQAAATVLPTSAARAQANALCEALLGTLFFDAKALASARASVARVTGVTVETPMMWRSATRKQWQVKLDHTSELLRHWPALFLQGPPGSGKTFCTALLAQRLQAQVFGPLSVGSDTSDDDVTGQSRSVAGDTVFVPGVVAQWAQAPGAGVKLLVVDEANLAPAGFWNALRGLFDPQPSILVNGEKIPLDAGHRVIFTGNQDTLAGRTVSQIIKSHFVTVPFAAFNDGFLLDEVLVPHLTSLMPHATCEDIEAARDTVATVLDKIRQSCPDTFISPRNIEEAAVRVSLLVSIDPSIHMRACAAHALLRVQVGALPAAQAETLRAWADLSWGAVPSLTPETWLAESPGGPHRLVMTASSERLAGHIGDFLAVRAIRRRSNARVPGQTGLLIEGPSGRGKDAWAQRMCEAAGLRQLRQGVALGDGEDGYYSLNAGLGFAHLREVIGCAQGHGHLVIISELNLLGSATVEGRLNALLQGEAAPGFGVIATVNPSYGGRRAISEAQRNRCICIALQEYREPELRDILVDRLPAGSEQVAERLVTYHKGVGSMLSAAQKSARPTLRELLRACDAMDGAPVDDVLSRIYQPYLAMANVARLDAQVLPAPPLVYHEALAHWIASSLGWGPCLKVWTSQNVARAGAVRPGPHAVVVQQDATVVTQVDQIILQSLSAAMHPWQSTHIAATSLPLWQGIADAMALAALQRLVPQDVATVAAYLTRCPSSPPGEACWKRACDAETAQAFFAHALITELSYPGTLAAVDAAALPVAHARLSEQARVAAVDVLAAIAALPPLTCPDTATRMAHVRLAVEPMLAQFAALTPRTAWQRVADVIPTAAMRQVWEQGAKAKRVMGRQVRSSGAAVVSFVAHHKIALAALTSPVWLPIGVAGVGAGLGLLAVSSVFIIGGELLGHGISALMPGGLFARRNLPRALKPFNLQPQLERLHQVEPAAHNIFESHLNVPEAYLAAGYLSAFDRHGRLICGTYDDAPPATPSGNRLGTVRAKVRSHDFAKRGKTFEISLPTIQQACPGSLRVWRGQEELSGAVEIVRVDDGRFVARLSHSADQLFGISGGFAAGVSHLVNTGKMRPPVNDSSDYHIDITLHEQPVGPPPKTYGRAPLPFRINYAAWPELQKFLSQLGDYTPEQSVAAICHWLNENTLYDRGRQLSLAYGWRQAGLSPQKNPVNAFLQLRRGTSLQSAQVMMALVRDRLGLAVRVATGAYLGTPRLPREEKHIHHAWVEVFFPKEGWMAFDPTPRRWADAWFERRLGFFAELRAQMGLPPRPPPHLTVLERLGDTYEHPQALRHMPAAQRLRVSYQVDEDTALVGAFAQILESEFGHLLFSAGLRPQQRLAAAPPGSLDIGRLARGEVRTFVNTDVGRAPLRKSILLNAQDLYLNDANAALSTRLSRVFWSAFFELHVPIEVACHDGAIMHVQNVDELLSLADTTVSVREYDRMATLQEAEQRRLPLHYAKIDWRAVTDRFHSDIACRARVLQLEPTPKQELTIKSLKKLDPVVCRSATDVTIRNISGRDRIYRLLQGLPSVRHLTLDTCSSWHRLWVPYMPQLQSLVLINSSKPYINLEYVPSSSPWGPVITGVLVGKLGTDAPRAPTFLSKKIISCAVTEHKDANPNLPPVGEVVCEADPPRLYGANDTPAKAPRAPSYGARTSAWMLTSAMATQSPQA